MDTFVTRRPRNVHKLIDEITLGDLIKSRVGSECPFILQQHAEIEFVCTSIKALAENHKTWALDYTYSRDTNEFIHKEAQPLEDELVKSWFSL
jgi:hypothetical protein